MSVRYAPFAPDELRDPYPMYRRLRSEDPVHWDPHAERWVLTRYDDVVATVRDPRISARRRGLDLSRLPESSRAPMQVLVNHFSRWILMMDPPEHSRLRAPLIPAFAMSAVEAQRPAIQAIFDELLNLVRDAERMDIIADLAQPLPVLVIGDLLGLPREDREQIKLWCENIAAILAGGQDAPYALERPQRAASNLLELSDYLARMIVERRDVPSAGLLRILLDFQARDDGFGPDDLLATCTQLLIAGHETTTNLIGNGTLALLRHPDQWRMLRDSPALIPGAVEEMIRFDAPVQAIGRSAGQEMEVRGRRIQSGDSVVLSLGAANRDPDQFPDPEKLDVTRRDVRHLGFGQGTHFCLGSPLARLEAQIVFGALLSRLDRVELVEQETEWWANPAFRSLKSLPIAFANR